MTSQIYIQRLRSAMSERKFTEEQISACCEYSSLLLSRDLPVLFDAQHVDKVLQLYKIDLNAYKEKQMRRRIDTLIGKNKVDSYDKYVELIKKDKEKFEQFVNFLTINV